MDTAEEHDHGPRPSPLACPVGTPDEQVERRLALAAGLNSLIVIVEFVGGLLTGSLALLSDAAHNLTDVVALVLSYLAHRLSRRPPSESRTYGWHRAEVFAAVVNSATLIVIGGAIIWEAWTRFYTPPQIKLEVMFGVAVASFAGNALGMIVLGHGHHDLNLRSAYVHIVGDVLASAGVVVAALVMKLTGQYFWDPVLSALIALAILYSSGGLLWEALHILLEGVPRGMKLEAVVAALKEITGVIDVHDVHLWSLCSNVHALSAHVVSAGELGDRGREGLIAQAQSMLAARFGIAETTLQVETSADESDVLLHAAGHATAEAVAHHGHHH